MSKNASSAEGKAIPFIILEDEKLKVCDEAKDFLSTVEAPVGVIAVAGMARTGKSVLLNQILLGKPSGFNVGATIASCTRGIWIWSKVLTQTRRDGSQGRFLVIDTEGIGSVEADEQHDASILSLALLLSSYFIYNAFGAVDERALNQLSLIANLTSHLRVHASSDSSSSSEHDHGGRAFAPFFPSFLWLLRDFSLQLVSPEGHALTPKQYLDRSLQPTPGADPSDPKEAVRRTLISAFRERDCFTLVRPVTDEKMLQDLSKLSLSDCRPEFATQAFALRDKILSEARPKAMNNAVLDGPGLAAIAERFTGAISGGGIPSIVDTFSYVQKQQNRRALDAAVAVHAEAVEELAGGEHPLTDDAMEQGLKAAAARARRELVKRMYAGGEGGGEEEREELEDKVGEAAWRLRDRSVERGKVLVAKMYAEVEKAVDAGSIQTIAAYMAEHTRLRNTVQPIVPKLAMGVLSEKLAEGVRAVGGLLEQKWKEEEERARLAEDEVKKLDHEMALERERGVLQGERERALMGEVEERKRETGRLREELERKTEEVERLRREMEGEREEAEKTRGKERAAREREQQAAVAQAAALKKAELAMKQVAEERAAREEGEKRSREIATAADQAAGLMERLCEELTNLCAAGTLQREWMEARDRKSVV